ncbi:lipopolysaccharide transport periplasmic protein LptA [Marinobacterium sedimentorum]|jgi:lipopolysaccharide export system protein LptA|uniref:lipopolysaccharide transport periplasmic protein LptA n=1 Tax=Marinobacterium sedimentorum TaxID=2927804 RepID=UPI0020C73C98|nr:lipopolysaccharide transport periplasmic protein LptA [Marinobacterium sedimentorum]MCP8687901.1 lipopolysaccharide transport periplasmic protein LptA [Marinobacterium sedimentorum]
MKPNNTRLWLAALLSLSISGTSLALPTDRNQPIHVSADTATIDDNTGITTYSGNVEIAQGSLKINARNVDLHRSESGVNRILATGDVKFEQQAAKDKPVTNAYGERMDYQVNRQEITITGKARVVQQKDTFTGQKIVYNLDKSLVNAFSGEGGQGRVQMVIQPKGAAQ